MNKKLKIGSIIFAIIVALVVFVVLIILLLRVLNQNRYGAYNYSADMFNTKKMAAPTEISDSWSESKPELSYLSESNNLATSNSSVSATSQPVDKKMIKNGNLNIRVDNLEKASEEINNIAKANRGEVSSTNIYGGVSGVKSGNISVKVPVANFEKTFSELKKVATIVISESTSGQDVTEQYTDLQAQLKNKQAEEQTFVRILDQAGKMDDVLAVTREISRVRGEIERLQGRIRLMDSQTDMSIISISLSEDTKITIIDKWRPLQVIRDSFQGLIKDSQNFINNLIVFIIRIIPRLVLWAIVIFLIYKGGYKLYVRFFKKNSNSSI